MDNLELMKQEISNLAKEKKEEFEKVSDYIFANPELAFKEYKSQEALCKLLESHGFVVKRGIAEMPTSFEAVFDSGKPGKTVALMGEYDCLPEIGHGCGHNLIGTSAAGAGIVLKEVMEKHEIGGVLKVLGCPRKTVTPEKCNDGKTDNDDPDIFCKKRADPSHFFHSVFHRLYLIAEIVDQPCFSNIDCHGNQNIFFHTFDRLHIQCIYHGYIVDLCKRLCFDHCAHL